MTIRRLSLLLVLLVPLLLGAAAANAEETGKTIFYNVTTDEAWASGMALGQATMAKKEGYDIVVFLNVRGVYLADKGRAHDSFSGTGQDAPEMLANLVASGGRVIICPMCMKKAGLAEADLVDGVEIGGPSVTFPVMTADDTVVLSY
jgi:predicted peroxiredoxin